MYHFANKTLRDGRPLPLAGDVLVHKGELVLCEAGYHMSERVTDALRYAPGTMLAVVEPGGEMLRGTDKLVARERHYVTGYVDISAALIQFARACALRALVALPDDCDLAAAAADAWPAARDAAGAAGAAWAAVESAARAAGAAVESAAWAAGAAAGAAWAAAWAAERKWQETRLRELLAPLMEMQS